MKSVKIFTAFITLFIGFLLSIWWAFLLYPHVHATDLMWRLFWPITATAAIFSTLVTELLKNK